MNLGVEGIYYRTLYDSGDISSFEDIVSVANNVLGGAALLAIGKERLKDGTEPLIATIYKSQNMRYKDNEEARQCELEEIIAALTAHYAYRVAKDLIASGREVYDMPDR